MKEVSMLLTCEKELVEDQTVHIGSDNQFILDDSMVSAALKAANLCTSCTATCELGEALKYVREGLSPKS